MMIKTIENKKIEFISGYLDALSDISGKQREFYTRIFLLEQNKLAIDEKIKVLLSYKQLDLLYEKVYEGNWRDRLLEKLILLKPFCGLYNDSLQYTLPSHIEDEYRKYILFHLSDYIDFALEEEGIQYPYSSTIKLSLLESQDNKLIVLEQTVQGVEVVLVFINQLNGSDFVTLFHELLSIS